jgi:hypothetical protein
MKIIKFFKNTKGLKGAFGRMCLAFSGVFFALIGFLLGLEQRGFHGMTVWFQFPALIFCFSVFCFTVIEYLRND